MNIDRINEVIAYIEEHLSDNIDIEKLAKISTYSPYELQKIFSCITDMSISEYIRKRRLSNAGRELKEGNMRVLDAALKYGYDSPVSFARAFKSFHGFNPSESCEKENIPKTFPQLMFQITVKEVMRAIRTETMVIAGKEYTASYFGEEKNLPLESEYGKRCYWRIENAEELKRYPHTNQVLPYSNYPPIDIQAGQIFVIDYYKKNSRIPVRKYYIADGTVWAGMLSTREFVTVNMQPLKVERISVCGKMYDAEYFGEFDIGEWSQKYQSRAFFRVNDAFDLLKEYGFTGDVLPYNNYPPIIIEPGQAFMIDYRRKDGGRERRYYIANGTVWNGMPSTAECNCREIKE